MVLLTTNMVAPLFFFDTLEARVVFGVAILNGALFTVLTYASGFSRLLGLGHLPWIPLVWFLATRSVDFPPDTPFAAWMWAVIVFNSVSLVLDAANVVRWIAGDRAEMVTTKEGTRR